MSCWFHKQPFLRFFEYLLSILLLSGVNYNFTFSYSLCINLVPGVSLYLNEEDNHSAEDNESAEEPDKDSTNTNSTYKHIQTKNFNNEAENQCFVKKNKRGAPKKASKALEFD